MEFSRELIIIILKLTITKIALSHGWSVRKLNNKQIELIKNCTKFDDYSQIYNIVENSCNKINKILSQ